MRLRVDHNGVSEGARVTQMDVAFRAVSAGSGVQSFASAVVTHGLVFPRLINLVV